MSKVGRYLARVSQEEASKAEVAITEKDATVQAFDVSEPEALDVTDLVEVCDKGQGETDRRTIDEIKHIQVALEELGRVMDSAQERGGLHPNEAAMLNVGLEHFGKRLGVTFDNPLPSMEDFGKGMTRRGALTVSQELYIVIDQALIDKIIALIKKMITKAKAFIGKMDLQTDKVTKIVDRVKDRYRRWTTGEVTFESTFGSMLTEADITPAGLGNLLLAGRYTNLLLHRFDEAVSKTNLAVMHLVNSEGNTDDVEKFNVEIGGIWGDQVHPLKSAMNGQAEKKLSSKVGVKLVPGHGSNPVNKYSLDFPDYKIERNAVSVTMNKGEFNTLVDRTEKMNAIVKDNNRILGDLVDHVGKFADSAEKAKSKDAARALFKILNEIEGLVDIELKGTVGKFGYIRNQVGYFLLLAGSEFDKGGASQDVANNTK